MAAQPLPTTFASALWPARTDVSALMRGVLLALLGTALLTLSAKVKVPFYPVPMTMQSMVVLMLGAAYGSRLAVATVLLYLAEGALGLPVFAGTPERGIGLAYMMGPTGGYLVGFVLAAGLVGWLSERGLGRSLAGMALAMTLGHAVLFAAGFAWLATLFGPSVAWTSGVAAFIPETLVKTALAAVLVPAAWHALDRRGA
jgi:biotin transport system substrate-specific component